MDPSDQQLVAAFLAAIEDLSLHEAEEATGISHGQIARYRRGEWKRLYPSTRRRMADYLAGHPNGRRGAAPVAETSRDEAIRALLEIVRIAQQALDRARVPKDRVPFRDVAQREEEAG